MINGIFQENHYCLETNVGKCLYFGRFLIWLNQILEENLFSKLTKFGVLIIGTIVT